jgi:hypothetical protein
MNEQPQSRIGPAGRWIIFSGVYFCVGTTIFSFGYELFERAISAHIISEKTLPYVVVGVALAIGISGRVLYKCCPRQLVIPVGVVGWILTFLLQTWYFWFGRGALGHH